MLPPSIVYNKGVFAEMEFAVPFISEVSVVSMQKDLRPNEVGERKSSF